MIKKLILIIFLPFLLSASEITTVYDCDDKASFYIKVVGDFNSRDVTAYWAGKDTVYDWVLLAKSDEIKFFRDKLIMNSGRIILESPQEGIKCSTLSSTVRNLCEKKYPGVSYFGKVELTNKKNQTNEYSCKVTFE